MWHPHGNKKTDVREIELEKRDYKEYDPKSGEGVKRNLEDKSKVNGGMGLSGQFNIPRTSCVACRR